MVKIAQKSRRNGDLTMILFVHIATSATGEKALQTGDAAFRIPSVALSISKNNFIYIL